MLRIFKYKRFVSVLYHILSLKQLKMKKKGIFQLLLISILVILSFSLANADSKCIDEKGQATCVPGTCKSSQDSYCGKEGKSFVDRKCYCSSECGQFGDCCSDYFETCENTERKTDAPSQKNDENKNDEGIGCGQGSYDPNCFCPQGFDKILKYGIAECPPPQQLDCAAPPQNCHYGMQKDENGCLTCGELICDEECGSGSRNPDCTCPQGYHGETNAEAMTQSMPGNILYVYKCVQNECGTEGACQSPKKCVEGKCVSEDRCNGICEDSDVDSIGCKPCTSRPCLGAPCVPGKCPLDCEKINCPTNSELERQIEECRRSGSDYETFEENKCKYVKCKSQQGCINKCGDGYCQGEASCLSLSCGCTETKESCSQDCRIQGNPSVLALIAPLESDRWRKESIQTIKWDPNKISGGIYIRLTKGGQVYPGDFKWVAGKVTRGQYVDGKYIPGHAETFHNNGLFDWVVPNIPTGDDYALEIIDSGEVVLGRSAKFSVVEDPAPLSFIAPTANEPIKFDIDYEWVRWIPSGSDKNIDIAVYQPSQGFKGLGYFAKNVPKDWLLISNGKVIFTWSTSKDNYLMQSDGNSVVLVPGNAMIIVTSTDHSFSGHSGIFKLED